MTHRWQGWRAQQPSAQFAERTVGALMRDRRRRRRVWGPEWTIVATTTAILMAGAAFASFSLRRAPATPAPEVTPTAIAPERSLPEAPAIAESATPPPSSTPHAPAAPRRKVEAPPPASSALDAGHKVILPRCNCSPNEATICDCF